MRSTIMMLIITGALTLASAATAQIAWYSGDEYGTQQYIGSNTNDSDCIWYSGNVRCSGGNTWKTNYMTRDTSGGTLLSGFENSARIRGWWSYFGTTGVWNHPSDVDMCCYLLAQTTWWNGPSVLVNAYASNP